MNLSSVPYITTGNMTSGQYYLYVTWTQSTSQSTTGAYDNSQVALARILFNGTTLATSIENNNIQTFNSTMDGTMQFGSSVAIDQNEGINVAYYSSSVPSGYFTTVNTNIIIARIVDFDESTIPVEYIQANSAITQPYDEYEQSSRFPTFDFTGWTSIYASSNSGIFAIWIDGRSSAQLNISQSGNYDNPKDLYCQQYSLPTGISGITSLNSQRKIVYDGTLYHCVYYEQDAGSSPATYSVYYINGADLNNWNQPPLKLSVGSCINPSLCLYKDGKVINVGFTWEVNQTSTIYNNTIYFASLSTTNNWSTSTWVVNQTVATAYTTSPLPEIFQATPVIAPVIQGTAKINRPLVVGLDSDNVDLTRQSYGTNSLKSLEGFIISFAQPEAHLDPTDPNHLWAGPDLVYEGIYNVLVAIDGNGVAINGNSSPVLSVISNINHNAASYRASMDNGINTCPASCYALAEFPSIASTEASHLLANGQIDQSYLPHQNTDYLSWVETMTNMNPFNLSQPFVETQVGYTYLQATAVTNTNNPILYTLPINPQTGLIWSCRICAVNSHKIRIFNGDRRMDGSAACCSARYGEYLHGVLVATKQVSYNPMCIWVREQDPNCTGNNNQCWSNLVYCIFTDQLPSTPPPWGSYQHPSLTANAYHRPKKLNLLKPNENYDLTGVIAEHKNLNWKHLFGA